MKDNLESFFKKNLSEEKPGDDLWNVPSDKVWEEVFPEIRQRKGIFIPWSFLVGFTLLLSIIVAGYWFVKVDDTSPDTVDNKSIEIADIRKENKRDEERVNAPVQETVNAPVSGKGKESSTAPVVATEVAGTNNKGLEISDHPGRIAKSLPIEGNKEKSSESTTPEDKEIDKLTESPVTVNVGSDEAQIALNNPNESHLETQSIENSFREASVMTRVDSLPETANEQPYFTSETDTVETSDTVGVSVFEEHDKEKKNILDYKGKFGIGAFFLPTYSASFITGDRMEGMVATNNTYLYSSNFGFEARYYVVNRLAVVLGVERSEIKSWSKSLVDFGYDKSTESAMPGGEMQNTSPVPMPTPFGEVGTNLTYSFPSSVNLPDGEVMQSDMETHQTVVYLSIPLGVEYTLLGKNRFHWFASGGIRYDIALRNDTRFSSRVLHQGDAMKMVSEEITSHPKLEQNYWGFHLGTGVNYQVSDLVQLHTSFLYRRNISKVNIQENMMTNLHIFNLKVGINFIF